eukprot:TRINITY_DN36768_c0_g1_i1.p1 TRINITY_DN36768_c0_g1~~TRINITY_DN36768_c0_g1_i1.p1  ORF type:complete len:675 (+),score=186.15 TRINITY_DN36768_c0_g1_i1:2864-4888(+)
MTGDKDCPGLIPLSIEHVFEHIANSKDMMFLLRASYYEIYNEQVRDLLNPDSNAGGNLALREKDGVFFAANLVEEVVRSQDEVMELLDRGARNRVVGISNMHERSSRSHAIFRMVIQASSGTGGGHIKTSELNLVDLAGSESLIDHGSSTQRKETGHINKSLSELTNVISALTSPQRSHIPYRNSALTKLLRQSLGGNAKTALICTITPAKKQFKQSKGTLAFGQRAKAIKNKPIVNETFGDEDKGGLQKYQSQISELNGKLQNFEQIADEKRKIQADYEALQRDMQRLKMREVERQDVEAQIAALQADFVSSDTLKKELEVAREEKEEKEQEAQQLNAALQDLIEENEKLQQEMHKQEQIQQLAVQSNKEKEAKLTELLAANAALASTMQKRDESFAEMRKQQQDKEREFLLLAEQNKRLRQEMQEKSEEQNAVIRGQEEKEAELASLAQENARLAAEMEERSQSFQQIQAANAALLQQVEKEKEHKMMTEQAIRQKEQALVEQSRARKVAEQQMQALQTDMAVSGLDKDSYLAHLIHDHEKEICALEQKLSEQQSLNIAKDMQHQEVLAKRLAEERQKWEDESSLDRISKGVETPPVGPPQPPQPCVNCEQLELEMAQQCKTSQDTVNRLHAEIRELRQTVAMYHQQLEQYASVIQQQQQSPQQHASPAYRQ